MLQYPENVDINSVLRCDGDEHAGLEDGGRRKRQALSSVRVASSRDHIQVPSFCEVSVLPSPCSFIESV